MKPVQKVFVALAVGLPLSMIGAGLAYQRVATTRDLTGTPLPADS